VYTCLKMKVARDADDDADATPSHRPSVASVVDMAHAKRRHGVVVVVVVLYVVLSCASLARAGETNDMGPRVTRARFERARYERASALGGWFKKATNSVSKGATSTTNAAVNTATTTTNAVVNTATTTVKTLSEKATEAYDAGKAMASSTYQGTYNNVVQKYGTAKFEAFIGKPGDMLKDNYDKAKGFTSGAVSQMANEANVLKGDLVAVAEMIVAFFNQFQCDIGPEKMRGIVNSLVSKFKAGGTKDLVNQIKNNPAKFYTAMDTATCDLIWNTVFTQASLAISAFGVAIETLQASCPALAGGGAKPAFTLGFTLAVDVTYASVSAGVGTEIGVGFDLDGNKFCYVGACVKSGRTFGSNSAFDADAEPGLALSAYKQLTSVPGECSLLDVGMDVNLPTPLKIEAGGGLTYLYSGTMGNFVGVQYPMSLSQAGAVPGVDVSLSRGMCCTPICIKTTGAQCSPTNWKNPCPTMADPNAYLNMITAASEAALGNQRTLDRSHEEAPYRRLGAPDAALGAPHADIRARAFAPALAVAVAVAVASVALTRRRRFTVTDENSPLLKR